MIHCFVCDQPSNQGINGWTNQYNDTLSTYMADEYSIRWMQDSTKHWQDSTQESLQQQFQDVRVMVKESQPQQVQSFHIHSAPCTVICDPPTSILQFGDLEFCNEPIEDFEAYRNRTDILKLLRNSITTLKHQEE